MELYNFKLDIYNKIVVLYKFRFYKQIKNTGIILEDLCKEENSSDNQDVYNLVCFDQENSYNIKFSNLIEMIYLLVKIAETRLSILLKKERELLEVINTEEYGESRYFNDKETTAMSINSTKNLINHFSEKLISLGVYDSM